MDKPVGADGAVGLVRGFSQGGDMN